MDRDSALKFIQNKVTNQNIIKHMLATEVVMRALSRRIDPNKERFWALAGLLHDGDYSEEVPVNMQGIQISRWIEEEKEITLPDVVKHAMAAHNDATGIKPASQMAWSLFCCDSLTGLIVATALVQPSKKLSDVTLQKVMKKYHDPSFAKGTRREDIMMCEEKLGIQLEQFVKMALVAMQGISDDLGL